MGTGKRYFKRCGQTTPYVAMQRYASLQSRGRPSSWVDCPSRLLLQVRERVTPSPNILLALPG